MNTRSIHRNVCLAGSIAVAICATGCNSPANGTNSSGGSIGVTTGGTTGVGGSSSGTGSSSKSGTSTSVAGATAGGGTTSTKTSAAAGGVGGKSSSTGGASSTVASNTRTAVGGAAAGGASANSGGTGTAPGTAAGGATGVGGTSSAKGSVGGSSSGGTSGPSVGGNGGNGTAVGGVTSVGGATGGSSSAENYFLPPPDQCHDVDQMPWSADPKTGCVSGDATSKCGGKCQTASACESYSSKPGADVEFMCPRDLLFSPEMEQAVKDDGLDGFHYAVVGHDPDKGGIDGNAHSCCQCYQLVYAYPSPNNEKQVLLDPDHPNPPVSAIPLPPPLIVQSFNTAATPTTFDVYMPAGGMGANNGCFPLNGGSGGMYQYTNYPLDGQPGQGGVKPVSLYDAECKTSEKHWVTEETLTSSACVARTKAACDKIASNIPGLTAEGSTNCLKANTIDTFYHMNWSVYAMKVECPEHLTRVTGCRLAAQSGVKAVKKDVKTADVASKDPDFWSKTSSSNNLYETTTMEDCCRPTCASYSQISSFGLVTDPQYRSFYNCDVNGVAWTQPQ
jgi:hypothetical protein